MSDDDWVKSAFFDDLLVAELLNRLRESVTLVHRRQLKPAVLDWGVRQPRSRNIPRYNSSNDGGNGKKNKSELTRGSPTTPLSWSAGTSYSGGGGGGDEESSVRRTHARSKLISPSDITKRSRKKKTFAELKVQEGLLLRDGIHLKRALASERKLYEKEKTRNESLKRLKIDLQIQSRLTRGSSIDTPVLLERAPVLPDLNMLPDLNFPFDEDFN